MNNMNVTSPKKKQLRSSEDTEVNTPIGRSSSMLKHNIISINQKAEEDKEHSSEVLTVKKNSVFNPNSKKNKKKDEEVFLSEIAIGASNDTTNFPDVSTVTIKMAGVLSPVKRVSPEDATEVKGLCQYLEGASWKDTSFGVVTKNIHLSKSGSRPTASSSSVGLKKNPAIARNLNITSFSDSIEPTEPTQKCRQEGLVACREENIALSGMLSDNRCDKTEKEESCELVSDYSEKRSNPLEEENNVRLSYTTSSVTDSPLSNAPEKSTVKDTYESLTKSSPLVTESSTYNLMRSESPAVPTFNCLDGGFGSNDEKNGHGKSLEFTPITKNMYSAKIRKQRRTESSLCDCNKNGENCSIDSSCINRNTSTECPSSCPTDCQNQMFARRKYALVEQFHTGKKGWGVKALENIEKGQFITELVGEVLGRHAIEKRKKLYAADKKYKHAYLCATEAHTIDHTNYGNVARFINHSCEPNAVFEKWSVPRTPGNIARIGVFALKLIKVGEEVTTHYEFDQISQRCYCGTVSCNGWMGVKPDENTSDEDDDEIAETGAISTDEKEESHLEVEQYGGSNCSGAASSIHPHVSRSNLYKNIRFPRSPKNRSRSRSRSISPVKNSNRNNFKRQNPHTIKNESAIFYEQLEERSKEIAAEEGARRHKVSDEKNSYIQFTEEMQDVEPIADQVLTNPENDTSSVVTTSTTEDQQVGEDFEIENECKMQSKIMPVVKEKLVKQDHLNGSSEKLLMIQQQYLKEESPNRKLYTKAVPHKSATNDHRATEFKKCLELSVRSAVLKHSRLRSCRDATSDKISWFIKVIKKELYKRESSLSGFHHQFSAKLDRKIRGYTNSLIDRKLLSNEMWKGYSTHN